MRNQKFTEVYKKYYKLVLKIVYERSGDNSLAEEICQQVFVAYYQNMDKIRDDGIKAWLTLATKNKWIDHLRKQNSRGMPISVECWEKICIVTEDNTERIIENMPENQLSFRIMEDLKKKNIEWYEVVFAICVDELSYEEASKYLRMSPQVLRSKLYRARKYIRKKYGQEFKRDVIGQHPQSEQ